VTGEEEGVSGDESWTVGDRMVNFGEKKNPRKLL
jgi:hypothetical protein